MRPTTNEREDLGPYSALPADLLAALRRYSGPLGRREVTVNVIEVTGHRFDELPDTPDEFVDWLKSWCDSAPTEYRKALRFTLDFDSGSYDDGGSARLSVWYTRPETDKEMAVRFEDGLRYLSERERQERAQYEALKNKFARAPKG